jgi:hypothetical protein
LALLEGQETKKGAARAAKMAMIEIWDLMLIIKVAKGVTSNKGNDCDKAKYD